MIPAGSVVRLDGPRAPEAREAAAGLLRSLGRPVAVDDQSPIVTTVELARAGVSSLLLGAPDAAERSALAGARVAVHCLTGTDEEPGITARRVLAAVDHGLEVASRPIFVVGIGRSGSSWVLELLGGHPGVRALFETELLLPERIGYLADPGEFDAERAAPVIGTRKGPAQVLDRETAIADMRALLAGWFARAVSAEDGWLAEKTPGHVASAEAIAELFPEARFIWVLRDLRDVVVSFADAYRSWMVRADAGRISADVSRRWRASWRTLDALRATGRVHMIRYEQLHRSPVAELLRAFAFCGIPCERPAAGAIVAAHRFERHRDAGPHRFRRGGRVGDWRTQLGVVDREIVLAIAGRELYAAGYLDRPPAAVRVGDGVRAVRRAHRARRRARRAS